MHTDAGAKFIDAATMRERLDDVEMLERRLIQDPADHYASSQLEYIYRADGSWSKLIELLMDRAELASAADSSAETLRQVAELYVEQLGDPESAFIVLQSAFSHDPTSAEITDAMDYVAHATGDWGTLIDVYSQTAMTIGDRRVSSDLWLRIACATIVSTGNWEDVSAALERIDTVDAERAAAYLDMVEQLENPQVLETLSKVCARIEDWARMARALSRAVTLVGDSRHKAHLHYQIADLHQIMGDEATAEWHLAECLRLDREHLIAREQLVEIYKQRGDTRKAAELLESGRFRVENHEDRAALGYEAATLYQDLDENTRALDLCRATLDVDPDHAGAAVPLAEKYWEAQRWQELEPIFDMLIRKASSGMSLGVDPLELYYRGAHCAMQLDKPMKARELYEFALEQDSVHLPSLLECADIYCVLMDWERAYEIYNAALIVQRGHNQSAEQLALTLFKMGDTRRQAADLDAALTLYESALDVGPCPDALAAAVEIYSERGDFRAVVQVKETQLASAEGVERVELLCELADITSRKLCDPHRAIRLYRDALDIDANCREALHQLVEHYSAAEAWREAVSMIIRIADLEQDSMRRGKYYQAAGTICRHHLGGDEAVAYLNKALDCFFLSGDDVPSALRKGCMKAFADIGRILYERQQWKDLERNYRRMIKRMKPDDEGLAELWHGLGQIYRKHLRLRESAISSFEVASQLDQTRATNHRILIDLYADAGPDALDKAIERRYSLIDQSPMVSEHYSALRSLFLKRKQYDRAWCACRALDFMGAASAKETEFFRRRRPEGILWPKTPMTEDQWARLRHEDENPLISAIMALVSDAAAWESSSSPRRLGLRNDDSPAFNHLRRLFSSVTYALGLRQAETYIQPDVHGDVVLANVRRGKDVVPAFVIGRSLYDGQSIQSIVHGLSRSLSYLRPHYYLRLCLPTSAELESVFLAASSLSRDDVPIPAQLTSWVTSYAGTLKKRMHPSWQVELVRAVNAFVREGKAYDLEQWGHAVDSSARRAGLLMTGDLQAAVAGFAREPLFTAGPSHEDKVRDILKHSVSPVHTELREQLGIAVD